MPTGCFAEFPMNCAPEGFSNTRELARRFPQPTGQLQLSQAAPWEPKRPLWGWLCRYVPGGLISGATEGGMRTQDHLSCQS